MADKRLGPAEWVNAGLKALAKSGFSVLKADTLANRLGISRGSFYWHFADVSAFHAAILRRWRKIALENIIEELDSTTDDRLETLMRARICGRYQALSVPCVPGPQPTDEQSRGRSRGRGADTLFAEIADRRRRSPKRSRTARPHHKLDLSRVRAVVEQTGPRFFAIRRQGPIAICTLET